MNVTVEQIQVIKTSPTTPVYYGETKIAVKDALLKSSTWEEVADNIEAILKSHSDKKRWAVFILPKNHPAVGYDID